VPYDKTVTVTEKRAPTDESIKLYGEMVDKARESLIDVLEIKDNNFNGVVSVHRDMRELGTSCYYRVMLNGEELTGKVTVRDVVNLDSGYDNIQGFLREVYEKVAKEISVHIANAAFRSIARHGSDEEFGERN
jgi:hypothetical protein